MNRTTRKVLSYTCLDQSPPESLAGLADRRGSNGDGDPDLPSGDDNYRCGGE